MTDIKLFSLKAGTALELETQPPQIEKALQTLFEANLETLLGVRFLATEYSTGPVHGGRIDTLGLDEDGSPVIIEYKRFSTENVINQGLFYLDWLLDHKKEFQWLVMDVLGKDAAANVEWGAPRLICIAGDFTKYDGHAVKQINRSIELLRYRRFDDDLLMIELAHSPRPGKPFSSNSAADAVAIGPSGSTVKAANQSQRIAYRIANASPALRDIYDSVAALLNSFGDDVQQKELQLYIAFKRIKNFACVEVFPQAKVVTAFLKLNPDTVVLEPGFTRDVRKIGHFGTGDLEVSLRSAADLIKAEPLFQRAYDEG
jgi:predicted transport protein